MIKPKITAFREDHPLLRLEIEGTIDARPVSGKARPVVDEQDVRRLCLGLPGVTERPSWGQPAWFARTLMARMWEDGVLTVKSSEREALALSEPDIYFWESHHDRSPQLVLIRLRRIEEEELTELLDESYRLAGQPKTR